MWQGQAQSRRRCGRGKLSPGTDVAGVSPSPGADVAAGEPFCGTGTARWRLTSDGQSCARSSHFSAPRAPLRVRFESRSGRARPSRVSPRHVHFRVRRGLGRAVIVAVRLPALHRLMAACVCDPSGSRPAEAAVSLHRWQVPSWPIVRLQRHGATWCPRPAPLRRYLSSAACDGPDGPSWSPRYESQNDVSCRRHV